jgi:hypothetical protein
MSTVVWRQGKSSKKEHEPCVLRMSRSSLAISEHDCRQDGLPPKDWQDGHGCQTGRK